MKILERDRDPGRIRHLQAFYKSVRGPRGGGGGGGTEKWGRPSGDTVKRA